MKRMRAMVTVVAALQMVAFAPAQMEKRFFEEYEAKRFAAAAPAVGSEAPDLQLCDLEGRPRSLRALLGRTVVLVKGSYT
jgi:hypothetical protein